MGRILLLVVNFVKVKALLKFTLPFQCAQIYLRQSIRACQDQSIDT